MITGRQRALRSWLSIGLLAVLCCILAVLQHRWIGEISRAERDRLREALQASLVRLSRDFNSEISAACAALLPSASEIDRLGRERAYATRYTEWKDSHRHEQIFRRVALAAPEDRSLVLRILDPDKGVFVHAPWPARWSRMRERLTALRQGAPPEASPSEETELIDLPRFTRMGPPVPFGLPVAEWLILEVDLDYLRSTLFPELLGRHLGGVKSDYQAAITVRTNPSIIIYQSDSNQKQSIGSSADAYVAFFDPRFDMILRRAAFGRGPGPGRPPAAPPPDSGRGRWLLSVRHRSGSLETIVERARQRNLAVSAGILLLILAAAAALVRFTRQAHRLAQLQMDFVAGVSHELRTPLTVIRTAAYNLRGKLAANPTQVERYGALIQEESEKLTAIVEQVLRFTGAQAGRVLQERGPLSVEAVVDSALLASKGLLEGSRCVVEKRIPPGLPSILGDSMALEHALQNLINNALKYGAKGGNWIGIFATTVPEQNGPTVEIRIADRGPGIPADEQEHIFEPFFRGKRAIQDQIHGTGLGLNLVKRIVEAHGGTIAVRSEPMKGSEFVVRIPAAPAGNQSEFVPAHGRTDGDDDSLNREAAREKGLT